MTHATAEEFIRYQSDALVLRLARFVWQMHIISAGLVVMVLWDWFSPVHLVIWAGWMSSFALLQACIAFKGTQQSQRARPIREWGRWFDGTAVLLALGWGWLGFSLQPENEQLRAFIGFLIAGGIVTGTGTHNAHYRMLVVTLLLIVPAQAARVVIDQPGEAGLISGSMLMLFMGLMLGLGWVLHTFTRNGFALQWEKSRLADQLEVQAEQLRQARTAAEEANYAKSHFLAQASHDLRQPLHGIGLLVASLPDGSPDRSTNTTLLRVRRSLDGLARLFDSLLDVTLLDTGQTKLTAAPVALAPLLLAAHDIFRPAAADRSIDLRIVSTRAHVLVDADILSRIVHNLIANALQHSRADRIVVGVRRRGAQVYLEVWDNGRGIPDDQQRRIFRDFERVEIPLAPQTNETGLGLGLAIVARLAAHHGIEVSVRSNLGRGSCFAVGPLQPTADEHTEAKPALQHAAKPASPASGHVWIIDDDQDARTGMTALLEKWGHTYQAMPMWRREDKTSFAAPDLVITDMHLFAGHSGLDVAAEIRRAYGKHVAVILITADTAPTTRQQVLGAGHTLLHKPVRPGQLRAAILSELASRIPERVSTEPS